VDADAGTGAAVDGVGVGVAVVAAGVGSLTGAAAGPFLAQAVHLAAAAIAASLLTLSAAALAYLTVPRMPAVIPAPVPAASSPKEH